MSPVNRFRTLCYTIEGIGSFAATFYFTYLYFFFRDLYGFSDRQNLLLAAGVGAVYVVGSWQAGRFAQRRGCFTALKVGFGVVTVGLAVGLLLHSLIGQIVVACAVNFGVCFIWPSLEALVSEGDPGEVPHAVGIYNITWAVTNAAATFIGGSLIKQFGYAVLFCLPLVLMGLQLAMIHWLKKIHPQPDAGNVSATAAPPAPAAVAQARNFQRLALLSNPAAYVAINTLIAVLPGIASKFHVSTMLAGFMLSLWCFSRVVTFVVLWRWTGWHYRFRWLVTSFLLLIASFATILVAPNLAVVMVAQIIFGMVIGLIYYSSLFYSMDASDTKGEHGGIHEAAIGIGNCLGPAIGASALWLAPGIPTMGAWAVSGLLTLGFGGLFWVRSRKG